MNLCHHCRRERKLTWSSGLIAGLGFFCSKGCVEERELQTQGHKRNQQEAGKLIHLLNQRINTRFWQAQASALYQRNKTKTLIEQLNDAAKLHRERTQELLKSIIPHDLPPYTEEELSRKP